jgi:uncharacterized protein YcnI
MKKYLVFSTIAVALNLLAVTVASAHVTLDPKTAPVGRQRYLLNVPTEKNIPTTSVRLVVPESVEVTGILSQPGWTHTEKTVEVAVKPTDDDSSSERITEITWTGGSIKPGEYMQFGFSTNYTGAPGDIHWKAYQTYSDGSVVAWDDANAENPAPKVTITKTTQTDSTTKSSNQSNMIFIFVALLFSVAAFMVSLKGKKVSV